MSHCIAENEVHYNPIINNNGYDYVDLGLPSGTLWATKNVGATTESDYGLYFAWGETSGYTKEEALVNERLFNEESWNTDHHLDKYLDGSVSQLLLEDDAANVNWGGDWHMPTTAQAQEIIDNTTIVYDDVNQLYTLTSAINGNTLTLPYGGRIYVPSGQSVNVLYSSSSSQTYTSTPGFVPGSSNPFSDEDTYVEKYLDAYKFTNWQTSVTSVAMSISGGDYGAQGFYRAMTIRPVIG